MRHFSYHHASKSKVGNLGMEWYQLQVDTEKMHVCMYNEEWYMLFSAFREGLKYLSQEEVRQRKKAEAGCRTTASNSSTGTTNEPCGNMENDHNRKTWKHQQQIQISCWSSPYSDIAYRGAVVKCDQKK